MKLRLTPKGQITSINLTGLGLFTAEWPLHVDPPWSEGSKLPQHSLRGPGAFQHGFRYGLDNSLAQILASASGEVPDNIL